MMYLCIIGHLEVIAEFGMGRVYFFNSAIPVGITSKIVQIASVVIVKIGRTTS